MLSDIGVGGFISSRGGIIIVKKILVSAVAEELGPFVGAEVWKLFGISCHSSEPVVEDNMELRSDGTGVQVEDEGYT